MVGSLPDEAGPVMKELHALALNEGVFKLPEVAQVPKPAGLLVVIALPHTIGAPVDHLGEGVDEAILALVEEGALVELPMSHYTESIEFWVL